MEEEARILVQEAMAVLENNCTGAVGATGPSLTELDKHVAETGNCWESDAIYDTDQRAWRLLEKALNVYREENS